MSKRRQPGEIVRRSPGSGFLSGWEPALVQVPLEPAYSDEVSYCELTCGDRDCREWANLLVIDGEFAGKTLCHIAECQMSDV